MSSDGPMCPVCEKMVCAVCLSAHFAQDLLPILLRLEARRAIGGNSTTLVHEFSQLARMIYGALRSVGDMRSELCVAHHLPVAVEA